MRALHRGLSPIGARYVRRFQQVGISLQRFQEQGPLQQLHVMRDYLPGRLHRGIQGSSRHRDRRVIQRFAELEFSPDRTQP